MPPRRVKAPRQAKRSTAVTSASASKPAFSQRKKGPGGKARASKTPTSSSDGGNTAGDVNDSDNDSSNDELLFRPVAKPGRPTKTAVAATAAATAAVKTTTTKPTTTPTPGPGSLRRSPRLNSAQLAATTRKKPADGRVKRVSSIRQRQSKPRRPSESYMRRSALAADYALAVWRGHDADTLAPPTPPQTP